MTHQDRIGVRRLWQGLRDELKATLHVAGRTSGAFWLACALIFVPLSTIGLLPFGRYSLVLQAAALLVFGLFMMIPGVLAREFRRDDDLELKDRESIEVVTHLPTLVVLAAIPFYLLGQAVLFRLTMQHLPGVLFGTSWADAWVLSLNNVLYTEIFLDVVEIFRLAAVPEPEHRLGKVMVFATRALLSLAFIRVLLEILRAAWYRSRSLGRGEDLLARQATAMAEGDHVEVRHLTGTIAANVRHTIDTLVDRLGGPQRESAWPAVYALRDWAIPRLEQRLREDPGGTGGLSDIIVQLQQPEPPVPHFAPGANAARAALTLALIATGLALVALVPGWPGLAVGTAALLGFGWLLVTPRSSIERLMRMGVLPRFSAASMSRATLIWALALAAVLIAAGFFVFEGAVQVAGNAFVITDPTPDGTEITGFLVTNLLRLQLFFGLPDALGIWTSPLEQRPMLGSALTLVFRTTLNVGSVAVLLTALSVSYDRVMAGSRLLGNDELLMRMEALRSGGFAPELARRHADLVREELWERLTDSGDPRMREALVADGVYDWVAVNPPAINLGNMVGLSTVAVALARGGWRNEAESLAAATGNHEHVELLFPQDRVIVYVNHALVLHEVERHAPARETLRAAAGVLDRLGAEMTVSNRTAAEEALAAGSQVVMAQTPDPPVAA